MAKQYYGVALHQETPTAFLDMFAAYLAFWNGTPHFYSGSIEHVGQFLELTAFPTDESGEAWKIMIPVGYVIAIVDMTEGKHPPGFLSGNEK